MTLKNELGEKLDKVWDILQRAKESFYYSYYLHQPETPEETEYLNSSRHFEFLKVTLWKCTVIELSKLFNKAESQDKFNLRKLLNSLKSNGHFRNLNFDENKILIWENKLNEYSITIKQIIDLRDKVYSHTDSNNSEVKKTDITFENTELLIKLCEEIIQTLFLEIFDTQADISFVYFNDHFKKIPKILADEEKKRVNKIIENFKNLAQK